jgi:pimeloyl-ACP methyl ester carboxylesterase
VNHHREGSGPPLVLIHGIGDRWQTWTPLLPRLAERYDVIACDSPGFGQSAPLRHAGPPDIAAYTDAFEQFFADRGIERPHIAGNSMGGAIGLELARRGVISSVTAFSPAGFWTPRERKYAQLVLGSLAQAPAVLHPLFRLRPVQLALESVLVTKPFEIPPDVMAAQYRSALGAPAFAAALKAFDDYAFVVPEEAFGVPTTVAWGNRDLLLPYGRQAPRAERALPQATHLTVAGGHVPFYDDPGASAAAIEMTAR